MPSQIEHGILRFFVVYKMSAIFDFSSLITIFLLFLCTCTFIKSYREKIFDSPPAPGNAQGPGPNEVVRHTGMRGFCWKMSRIGERKSEYVGAFCVIMAIHVLFFK